MSLKSIVIFFVLSITSSFVYSQSTTSYVNGPVLPEPRTQHQMEYLPNGNLLIIGGNNGTLINVVHYKKCLIYNSVTNSYEAAASMHVNRSKFMSTVLNDGNIIAIGGDNGDDLAMLSCEIYDATTNVWSLTDSLNTAHFGGRAIKLNDGRILVAGGTYAQTEVYNSATKKWSYVGDMGNAHGEGMSLTLLQNGNVLAVGGNNAPTKMEIFSPVTNQWTTLTAETKNYRQNHGAVLMNDGKVLLAGSSSFSTTDQKAVEIFDPATNSTQTVASLFANSSFIQLVALDNGNILNYGLGDLFETSTKIFQEYNRNINYWNSGSYTTIGTNNYAVKRLADGRIFYSGGDFTVGNSASPSTYIVTQNGYSSCTPADLNSDFAVSSVDNCYGKSAKIKFLTTSLSSTYFIHIGENLVGSFNANGESNVEFTIPSNYLTAGKNLITVKVAKSGCVKMNLKKTLILNMDIKNLGKPNVSILSGDLLLCNQTSKVIFNVNNPGIGTYKWQDGSIGTQIEISQSVAVSVVNIDAEGCISAPSNDVNVVQFSPQNVYVGNDLRICVSSPSVQLVAFPTVGSWTGTSVSSSGVFTPQTAGEGYFTMTYNICGYSKTQNITVVSNKINHVASDFTWLNKDTLCGGSFYEFVPLNKSSELQYTLYANGNYYSNNAGYGSTGFMQYHPTTETTVTLTMKVTKYFPVAECPVDTFVASKFFNVYKLPSASTHVILQDTACIGARVKIKVVNPEAGVVYYPAFYTGTYDPYKGTAVIAQEGMDTLFLASEPMPQPSSYDPMLYVYALAHTGCSYVQKLDESIYITPFYKGVSMYMDYVYEKDEPISPVLTYMDSETYSWLGFKKFKLSTNGSSTQSNKIPEVVYNNPGEYPYQLISYYKFGCQNDTLEKDLKIISPAPSMNQTVCYFDTCNLFGDYNIYSSVFDKRGNAIYVGARTREYGSMRGESGFVQKYGSDGKLMWKVSADQTDFLYSDYANYYYQNLHSMNITGVTVDDFNNIYITGNYTALKLKFGSYTIDNTEFSAPMTHAFVAKMDEYGSLKWFIKTSYSNDPIGGADIKYTNNKLYVSARLLNQLNWSNHLGESISVLDENFVGEYSILEIEPDGSSVRALAAINSTGYNFYYSHVLALYNPTSGGPEGKTAIVSPKLHIWPNNKIGVSGIVQDEVDFGSIKLLPKTSTYFTSGTVMTEFTGVIDPTQTDWEKVQMESYTNSAFSDKSRYLMNAVYSENLDKFSMMNIVDYDWYSSHTGFSVWYNENDSITSFETAALIKRINKNGELVWSKLLYGAEARQVLLSKNESQLIVVGSYNYIKMNEQNKDFGLTNKSKDIYAIGYNAANGDLLWIEHVGSDNHYDGIKSATLNDCGDLLITAKRLNYNYDLQDTIRYENNKLTSLYDYSYSIKIATTGTCNLPACNIATPPAPVVDPPIITSIGNRNLTGQHITLYPNPASQFVVINSLDGKQFQQIIVSDLQGRIIKSFNDTDQNRIDVSDLGVGMYLVSITIDGNTSVQKMQIVR